MPPDDKRLKAEKVEFPSPHGYGKARGYLVHPAPQRQARPARLPTILVAHENRGLNPHIEDIARRLALEGFVAFAPDALFPLGGYPGDEDKARALFAKLDQTKTREDFVAAAGFARSAAPGATASWAWSASATAAASPTFSPRGCPISRAAVPFYGSAPPPDQVKAIKAALLLHFAEQRRPHQRHLAAVRGGAQGGHVKYEAFTYPRHRARLQQRHHPALRSGRRQARLAAHASPSSIERCAADAAGSKSRNGSRSSSTRMKVARGLSR